MKNEDVRILPQTPAYKPAVEIEDAVIVPDSEPVELVEYRPVNHGVELVKAAVVVGKTAGKLTLIVGGFVVRTAWAAVVIVSYVSLSLLSEVVRGAADIAKGQADKAMDNGFVGKDKSVQDTGQGVRQSGQINININGSNNTINL